MSERSPSDAALNSSVRRFWRTVSVVGLAALVIGLTAPNVFVFSDKILLPVNIGAGWAVTAVFSPADAWLRVGDRVDPASLTPDGRLVRTGGRFLKPGEVLHLVIERAGQRRAIAIQIPSTPAGSPVVTWLKRLTTTIFVIVAALLVLLRPCRMTWGFFFFALGSSNAGPYVVQELSPSIFNPFALLFNAIMTMFSFTGFLLFASRFPSDSTYGWRAQIDHFAPLAGLMGSVVNVFDGLAIVEGRQSLNFWNNVNSVLPPTILIIGMVALIGGYFHMTSSQRQRLKWVVAGFSIALLASSYQYVANLFPNGGWPEPWGSAGYTLDALYVLNLFIPATVAYAVLKHHVLDVNFVISRALVIGTLTTSLVAAFALVDWFFTKAVEQQRLAVYAEVGVALAFGFGLNGMHHRVDVLIERVLFRPRHLPEARLDRIAAGVSHAVSDDAVDAALVREPAEALRLKSAAIFRRQSSGSFVRTAAVGWQNGATEELHPNDPIVLHMQGERGPMRLRGVGRRDDNFPKDAEAPIITFPLLVRHQLEGLALYGTHETGEDMDPDEIRTLERLARSAAAAYDHLEAESIKLKVGSLISENELLRTQLAEAQIQPA